MSFFLSISDEMPHTGDALLYRVVAKVERPLFPGYVLHGNHPSVPTCPFQDMQMSILTEGFLRSAAHEGVLRCASIPNSHSASDRCRPPISYFVRSTRVRLVYLDTNRCAPMFYCIKNTSRFVRCQPALCMCIQPNEAMAGRRGPIYRAPGGEAWAHVDMFGRLPSPFPAWGAINRAPTATAFLPKNLSFY